jgi:hypothetical protein
MSWSWHLLILFFCKFLVSLHSNIQAVLIKKNVLQLPFFIWLTFKQYIIQSYSMLLFTF